MNDGDGPWLKFLERLLSCRRLINAAPSPVRLALPRVGPSPLVPALDEPHALFGIHALSIVDEPIADATAVEHVIARRLVAADSALQPPAARGRGHALAQLALSRDPLAPFRQRTIHGARGLPMRVVELGSPSAPAYVVMLPYGVPVELSVNLARAIAAQFRFVAIEGPELSADADAFERRAFEPHESATDIAAVLDALELPRAHLVGMCASAMPVLRFAAQHPQRLFSLTLGNPAFAVQDLPRTRYERDFVRLVNQVGGQRAKARMVHRFLSSQLPAQADPDWAHVTMLPYANPDLLYMYTHCCHRLYADELTQAELAAWLSAIACPALVLATRHDPMTGLQAASEVAKRFRTGQLVIQDEGNHLSPMSTPIQPTVAAMLEHCQKAQRHA